MIRAYRARAEGGSPAGRGRGGNVYLEALPIASLIGLVGVTALGVVGGGSSVLQLAFPVLATGVGALWLWQRPAGYLGYTWWLWFLTPEVRRLVDNQTGYTEASLVMVAPFLVSCLAAFPVFFNLHRFAPRYRLPFALVLLGLMYGYGIGVLLGSVFGATFDLLNWLAPVVLGAYLLVTPHHFEAQRRVVQRTFIWGVLVMGLYGLYQFLVMPAWDSYWMVQSDMGSIGSPEPFEVRVFSTLNSPGPFAVVMLAGLLLLLRTPGVLRWGAAAVGFASFMLSLVRSAWGGLVVGLLVLAAQLPARERTRLALTLVAVGVAALPLLRFGPIAESVNTRFESLDNVQGDVSYRARLTLYTDMASFLVRHPLGLGLGSTGVAADLNARGGVVNLDSGVIAVPYAFGALGTLYYAGGVGWLFALALARLRRSGAFGTTCLSVAVAGLSQVAFGNAWVGVMGVVIWFFLCLTLSSYEFERSKRAVGKTA